MMKEHKNVFRSWVGLSFVLFALSFVLLLHDSVGIEVKLNSNEIQSIAALRPVLFDPLGNPVKVPEDQFEHALSSGSYRFRQGAQIAVISPHNQVAQISISDAPLVFLKGWRLEPLDHQVDRVISEKQRGSMWMADTQTLFVHSILCQFCAILFMWNLFVLRSSSKKRTLLPRALSRVLYATQ
jgi:hypothetical protein